MDVTALTNSEVLMNFAHIIKLTWRYTKMKIMLFVSGIFEVFFLEDEKKFENGDKTVLTQSYSEFLPFVQAEKTAFTVLDLWFPERHRLMNIMLTDHSSHGKKRNVHDISETRNPNPSYIDDITDLADDPIIQAELKGMNDISLSIKLLNLEKRFLQLLSS
ncbi:uncharacterized protein isoform X3 [Rhodnius prolixus]|uniref:uncharacterized protein isoform X3 n=1 Tax=Rhodnius prolixus TaxID=13249 RepID=UPI003D189305